jgi:hypothetical protein
VREGKGRERKTRKVEELCLFCCVSAAAAAAAELLCYVHGTKVLVMVHVFV